MSHEPQMDLDPDRTLADALDELRRSGVSSAAIMQDDEVLGHLSIRGASRLNRPHGRGDEYRDLDSELRLAKQIQQRLLPRSIPQIPGLSVYGTLVSARAVGGDYWSAKYYRSDNRVTLKLSDVTGHGIAAALLVPAVKFISGGFYRGAESPGWVMARTNHVLVKETPVEIQVSMVYAWYDTVQRTMLVVNAGHRPAFLVKNGAILDIPTSGPLLGLIETDYGSSEYSLQPGDVFFACSDGITEANSPGGRYGEERVKELVLAHAAEEPRAIAVALLRNCREFAGRPEDDRSVLIARVE